MVDARLADESFCYLTTRGRVSGRPHEIEIWFSLHGDTIYMLSGGADRSDWVKNLKADPSVSVRIGDETFDGTARTISDPEEDARARDALVEKYQPSYARDLSDWKKNSLPIAIDLAKLRK
jgi:deazaflavin-dependent oxidoreductase (nitroreductase family)